MGIAEWRKTREKEEDELKKLKEKQAKRKEIRAEQEKKLNQQKKEEEEKLRQEENEKKAKEAEEKKKKLEEAEAARKEMLEAQKAGKEGAEKKKIALSIRLKPLELDAMDSDELKAKATEIFNIIIQLETDKYDYEQRKLTQELDLKELKERQKAQLRQKALKKGLDPEAFVGKYPPMIRMYSKYERRTDTRTYDDRKKLYEGGWEVIRAESLDAIWKEKYEEWSKRPSKKLPKWFGERPGKKAGDAETPEGEEEGGEEAPAEDEYDEEEEEEEEEKKKKSKHYSQKTSDLSTNCASLSICSKPHEICSTFLTELKLPTHCCDKTDFWYRSNDMYG